MKEYKYFPKKFKCRFTFQRTVHLILFVEFNVEFINIEFQF